jgi:hypothetical protein
MALRNFQVAVSIVIGILSFQQVVAQPRDFLRKASIREVEADLQATLSDLLGSKTGTSASRLDGIEAGVWQTFQALPKNSAGRLAPPAVRYIVHGYFAREHGWLIKGLEPHGMQGDVSQVHEVSIMQDKAPLLVEQLLEARQSDRGLALNDIVAMIAVLEQMMFDESVTLLQAAYRLNGLPVEDEIDTATLHRVLQSYLLLFSQGAKADLFNVEGHKSLKAPQATQEFEHDTVLNFEFKHQHQANPFKPRLYSFQSATDIMLDLAQQYGKWQNSECRDMKAVLKELDPEGLGVVPLSRFYAQPEESIYQFRESAAYLKKIGALDESIPGNPKVFITNYVYGPSNCIASSSYYSVCCISECAHLLAELEQHVSAPAAPPKLLLDFVGNLSDTPLAHGLSEKLDAIAAVHGGEVPLHGRLFAQWLHFAFPHECPYPSVVQSATALTASGWLGSKAIVSEEERRRHSESSSASTASLAENLNIDERWSDYEILPVHAPPSAPLISFGAIRVIVQLVAVAVILRSALAAWSVAGSMHDDGGKKDDDFSLRV